jgi:hypothetical protein
MSAILATNYRDFPVLFAWPAFVVFLFLTLLGLYARSSALFALSALVCGGVGGWLLSSYSAAGAMIHRLPLSMPVC